MLGELYPYAVAELDFTNAFELLIATVLSAQTTDIRVNAVTPVLFARYPDAKAMAEADEADLQAPVRLDHGQGPGQGRGGRGRTV
jgi:endonuclease III